MAVFNPPMASCSATLWFFDHDILTVIPQAVDSGSQFYKLGSTLPCFVPWRGLEIIGLYDKLESLEAAHLQKGFYPVRLWGELETIIHPQMLQFQCQVTQPYHLLHNSRLHLFPRFEVLRGQRIARLEEEDIVADFQTGNGRQASWRYHPRKADEILQIGHTTKMVAVDCVKDTSHLCIYLPACL